MPAPRRILLAAVTAVAVFAVFAASGAAALAGPAAVAAAAAASRPPIKDCGDVFTLDRDNVFVGAVTAQRTSCANARAIARTVARSASCKRAGSCRVRAFACLLARAGKELTLVRCANGRETAFARFEFGA